MSLEAPQLDTRTWADLVAEARRRIPRYTPEWTDLNDSDPGMTLVQLFAWLTELTLYQMNRVPERNYVEFLNLLNLEPRPAQAAVAGSAIAATSVRSRNVRRTMRDLLPAPPARCPRSSLEIGGVRTLIPALRGP